MMRHVHGDPSASQELLGDISGADGSPLYFAGDRRPFVMPNGYCW